MKTCYRKPLVVIGPKTLLRLPEASCAINDLTGDSLFVPVIGDPLFMPSAPFSSPSASFSSSSTAAADADQVRRVVLVSGKLYYELAQARKAMNVDDVALIRVEVSITVFSLLVFFVHIFILL